MVFHYANCVSIQVSRLLAIGGLAVKSQSAKSDGDEKAGLRRVAVRSQVIDVLKAQIKRRPAMKKISAVVAQEIEKCLADLWGGDVSTNV